MLFRSRRTFNLGIGMMVIVAANKVEDACKILETTGETVYQCGRIVTGKGEVGFSG